jgi:hypothetical protein
MSMKLSRIIIAIALMLMGAPSLAQIPGGGGLNVTGTQSPGLCPIATSTVNLATWGACASGGSISLTPGTGIVLSPDPILSTGSISIGPTVLTAASDPTAAGQCATSAGTASNSVLWAACSGGGGAVSSVFGRTGTVVATTGDYTIGQISGAGTAAALNTGTSGSTLCILSGAACTFGTFPVFPVPSGDILVGNVSGNGALVALSGDATLSNAGALTLDTVNSNVGSFGGVNSIPSFTVNAKGLVTAAAANVPAIPFSELTGTATTAQLPAQALTAASNPTATGQCATSGSTSNNSVLWATCSGGGGSVTSVFGRTGAVVAASGDYTVAQVTGAAPSASPTFTGTVTEPVPVLPSQTANTVFAAPNGSAGAPGFRALASADIPAVPFTGVTGTATLAQLPQLSAFNSYCNNSASTAAPYDCLAPVLHSSDPTFGAVGNGTTDDTTAIQAWITACGTRAIICVLDAPASCYKTTATLVASANGEYILGSDRTSSKFCPSSTTLDGIQVTGSGITLDNFSIIPSVAATAGSCIHVGTSAQVNNVTIDRMSTTGFNCFNFVFEDESILFSLTRGSVSASNVAYLVNFGGDSSILNNSNINGGVNAISFTNGSAGGGGLRVIGNKINTIVGTGAAINVTNNATGSADVLIEGNSIEGSYPTSIAFVKGTAASFASAQIIGNEFSSVNSCVTTDSNAGWLQQLQINDNICSWSQGAATTGMVIGSAPAGFQILGNQFNGESGSGLAISVASGAVNGLVSNNQVVGTSASPAITNASTTTNTLAWAPGALSTNSNITMTSTSTCTLAASTLCLQANGATPTIGANGEGFVSVSGAEGINFGGKGSVNDMSISTNTGLILAVPTGTDHLIHTRGLVPTVSSCGTGTPTISTGSSDVRGSVTTGTAATSCTITFQTAWIVAPFCVVSANSAVAIGSGVPSTTAFTTTMAALSGGVITWICLG